MSNPECLPTEGAATNGVAATNQEGDHLVPKTHPNQWYNQDFDGYRVSDRHVYEKKPVRIVCIGAGFTGLQLAHKAEKLLEKVDLQIYEKSKDVGGTWLDSRYPGCRCDIPSHAYQYSWARNPRWSQFNSSAEEIWEYLKDVAKKFGLEKYVKLEHRLDTATWDEGEGIWRLQIQSPDGSFFNDYCHVFINASGALNDWKYPDIPGLRNFKGSLMHSAAFDETVDLSGKKVVVIGSKSSGVQVVEAIQPIVKKLTTFIRSPNWISKSRASISDNDKWTNVNYSEEEKQNFESDPAAYEKFCHGLEAETNRRFPMLFADGEPQKQARQAVETFLKEKLKGDDKLLKHLLPQFPLYCNRQIPGIGYLEALVKDNVEVVIGPAVRVTEDGVIDDSGAEHDADVIICATGFKTNFAAQWTCVGKDGRTLQEQFGDFPKAYLGVMAENFPNFFFITGPNSPVAYGSFIPVAQWHTRYIFEMITKMQEENIKSFEPKKEAIRDFYNHTHEYMKRMVWSAPCRSWFKNGKDHGPVTAVWPGSKLSYFEIMRKVRYEDYNISYGTGNRFQFVGNGLTKIELDPDGDWAWYLHDEFLKV
ncbi:hypothetical protein CLAIMM_09160 [Cladophialophora immunda]|nr:hypothetical protein CLAIMM_09160 [Cladophialophora immunda]